MITVLIICAALALAAQYAPRLATAWTAASTARRISLWHRECEEARITGECERAMFAAWERELA